MPPAPQPRLPGRGEAGAACRHVLRTSPFRPPVRRSRSRSRRAAGTRFSRQAATGAVAAWRLRAGRRPPCRCPAIARVPIRFRTEDWSRPHGPNAIVGPSAIRQSVKRMARETADVSPKLLLAAVARPRRGTAAAQTRPRRIDETATALPTARLSAPASCSAAASIATGPATSSLLARRALAHGTPDLAGTLDRRSSININACRNSPVPARRPVSRLPMRRRCSASPQGLQSNRTACASKRGSATPSPGTSCRISRSTAST